MPNQLNYKRVFIPAGEMSFPDAVDQLGIARYLSEWEDNPARRSFPFLRKKIFDGVSGRHCLENVRKHVLLEKGTVKIIRRKAKIRGRRKSATRSLISMQKTLRREILQALHIGDLQGKIYLAGESFVPLNDKMAHIISSHSDTVLCSSFVRLRRGSGFIHALVTINRDSLLKLAQREYVHQKFRGIKDKEWQAVKTFFDETLRPALVQRFGDDRQEWPKFSDYHFFAIARHVIVTGKEHDKSSKALSTTSFKKLGAKGVPPDLHSPRGPPEKRKRDQLNQLLHELGIDMSEP